MARGWKKFDEIKCKDGEKLPVKCNTETGEFMVDISDPENPNFVLATFKGKNLGKVKADAVAWMEDNDRLSWEPIITVRGASRWNGVRDSSDDSLDLHYKRAYRSKRPDGSYLWREFSKDGQDEVDEDEVKGKPGGWTRGPGVDEDTLVLPYTAERWSALRMISLLVKQLNERIHALLDQGRMDEMLLSIAQRGAALLLPAPKSSVSKED